MLVALVVLALPFPPGSDPAAPPTLRLPGTARPVRQVVELSVDPGLETYSGAVEIDLDVTEPMRILWLNATGLKITSASLGRMDHLYPARVIPGGDDTNSPTSGSATSSRWPGGTTPGSTSPSRAGWARR